MELREYVGVNLRKFRSILRNIACAIDLYHLEHPILQLIHGWLISTSHSTSSFADFSATTSLILGREEVRTSKVGGCIVVGTIRLEVAACFAAGEWYHRAGSAFRHALFAHPDFATTCMMTINVPT